MDIGKTTSSDLDQAGAFITWLKDTGPDLLACILYALVIFVVGYIVAHMVSKAIVKIMSRGKLKDEKMLMALASRSAKIGIIVVAGIMALSKLGISIAPFVASLGATGLILGFAFKDSLSNLASGLLILIYRPFNIGDTIDVDGTMGNVIDLTIINTTIKDFAGPIIYLPNSKVWGSKITNYAKAEYRRAIFTVGISYGDDQNKAWDVLQKLINEEERILKDPAPFIRLSELADSSVNFQMFVYTEPGNYGALLNDFYAKAKTTLEAAGYSIPFPQRDVHMTQG